MSDAPTSDELKGKIAAKGQPQEQQSVNEFIARLEPAIVQSLGTSEATRILIRHIQTAYRFNPQLRECSAESIAASVLLTAQMRLEPGPLGHVYLVPYGSEVVWMLGYTGIIELARRSNVVGGLTSEIVYDGDVYDPPYRENGALKYLHKPVPQDERGEVVGILVTWQERSGGKWFPRAFAIPPSRIERAKKASPAFRKRQGPWVTDEEAMVRKTGVRAVRPWLPLSTEAAYAFGADNAIVADLEVDDLGNAEPVLELQAGDSEDAL